MGDKNLSLPYYLKIHVVRTYTRRAGSPRSTREADRHDPDPADSANFQNCHTFYTFQTFQTFYTCYKIVTLFILFRLFTLFTLVTTCICCMTSMCRRRAAAARRPCGGRARLNGQCCQLSQLVVTTAANPRPNKSFRTWAVNLGSS
jgi:hypothetical protein